ncbi:MAG TPA: helix-turn-helix transcriptional regulator [Rhizomicrobium sp.]|nr:helix-turn-helix transcriptional regulator [Rhizomicrobium sp.]
MVHRLGIESANIGFFNIGKPDLIEKPRAEKRGVWIGPEKHKIVGKRLETARKKAGVTQVELAKRLGKPQSFVSSYESGQRRVDLLEFASIVRAIGGDAGAVAEEIFGALETPRRQNAAASLGRTPVGHMSRKPRV